MSNWHSSTPYLLSLVFSHSGPSVASSYTGPNSPFQMGPFGVSGCTSATTRNPSPSHLYDISEPVRTPLVGRDPEVGIVHSTSPHRRIPGLTLICFMYSTFRSKLLSW
jgi:hypothetical protein